MGNFCGGTGRVFLTEHAAYTTSELLDTFDLEIPKEVSPIYMEGHPFKSRCYLPDDEVSPSAFSHLSMSSEMEEGDGRRLDFQEEEETQPMEGKCLECGEPCHPAEQLCVYCRHH